MWEWGGEWHPCSVRVVNEGSQELFQMWNTCISISIFTFTQDATWLYYWFVVVCRWNRFSSVSVVETWWIGLVMEKIPILLWYCFCYTEIWYKLPVLWAFMIFLSTFKCYSFVLWGIHLILYTEHLSVIKVNFDHTLCPMIHSIIENHNAFHFLYF